MEISRRVDPGATIISLVGQFDQSSAAEAEMLLEAHLREAGPSVVLDLGGVSFMSASGLGVVRSIARKANGASQKVAVACPKAHVRRLFAVTRLDTVFVVRDSVADALDALRE